MNEKLKELGKDQGGENSEEDDDPKKAPAPVDYEFEVGMIEQGINEPDMRLPEVKDTLFVTKPIDKYEPLRAEKQVDGVIVNKFEPDPNQIIRKKFSHEPKTHSEIRDTLMELTAEMLQKINAGPVRIEFGSVYIKSKMIKTFYIKNDLRTSISVRLYTERDEFSLSHLKPQM